VGRGSVGAGLCGGHDMVADSAILDDQSRER
jgi:hypothetical protein